MTLQEFENNIKKGMYRCPRPPRRLTLKEKRDIRKTVRKEGVIPEFPDEDKSVKWNREKSQELEDEEVQRRIRKEEEHIPHYYENEKMTYTIRVRDMERMYKTETGIDEKLRKKILDFMGINEYQMIVETDPYSRVQFFSDDIRYYHQTIKLVKEFVEISRELN